MKLEELSACPVGVTVQLVGGKWKMLLFRELRMAPCCFGDLRRKLRASAKALSSALKEMEEDGLVARKERQHGRIKRVEYALTPIARSFAPILDRIASWGDKYRTFRVNRQT